MKLYEDMNKDELLKMIKKLDKELTHKTHQYEFLRHRSNEINEIERLNKKIEQYENPEDMTLMLMWCDEKAKDEIKRLNNIINELEKWVVEWREMLDCPDFYEEGIIDCINDTLTKLQELKGSDKE